MSNIYEWQVIGNYGYGWDLLFTATDKSEAIAIINDYVSNDSSGIYRLRSKRVI